MKSALPALTMLACIVITLNSCTVGKNSLATQKAAIEPPNENSASCFIQLKDGTVKQFKTLKLVTGVLTTPHLLADGKEIIKAKEIMAYQNNRHYAVSAQILTSTKNTAVAAETLPGFAVKVVSGKLNVYCRKYYNGTNTADEYFLQQGNDGYIVSYTKAVLKSMIKEDNNALEYFNSKTKITPKSKKILAVAELYNSGQLMTKN